MSEVDTQETVVEVAVEEVTSQRPSSIDDLKTTPIDRRFPSTNQARHCYTRYNEYYKCLSVKDGDTQECFPFKKAFLSICPSDWVERWEESRSEGTWPGKY